MARAQATDFLHSMRFFVNVVDNNNVYNTSPHPNHPDAGFSACTVPEATIEAVEYKEGQFLYTRKYPGNPTYGDVTLSRGVTRGDTQFWSWISTVIEGTSEYRSDVRIFHYHRNDSGNTVLPGNPDTDSLNFSNTQNVRTYYLFEAFPIRHKFATDLDGTDSAISIMELDLAYEHCKLEVA